MGEGGIRRLGRQVWKLGPCVNIGFSKKKEEVGITTRGCRHDLLQKASEAVTIEPRVVFGCVADLPTVEILYHALRLALLRGRCHLCRRPEHVQWFVQHQQRVRIGGWRLGPWNVLYMELALPDLLFPFPHRIWCCIISSRHATHSR